MHCLLWDWKMGLHYIICDTELTQASFSECAKLTSVRQQPLSSTVRKIALLSLVVANLVLWTFVYEIWPEKEPPVAGLSQTAIGAVTGIMYSEDKPSAIMHGKVVYKGDVVAGYRIVKIDKREVVFEKDGRVISKQVSVSKKQ